MLRVSGLSFFIYLIILFSSESFAEQSPGSCQPIKSAEDFLRCALEKHPAVQRAQIEVSRASKREGKASAFSNPEIETTTTYGKNLGDRLWTFESSLNQKFEMGGKRSSRIDIARAEADRSNASLKQAKEAAFFEVIHSLNRHRQIHEEIEIVSEAIAAFEKVESLYRKRGRLSAEQEIASEIFALALGENRLKRSKLQSEKEELMKRLEFIVGQKLPEDESYLPEFKKIWPEVPSIPTELFKSSATLLAEAELKSSMAELRGAHAESWPDLTIGPVFNWDRDGASDIYRYGLNLNLPLPLWNWNRSGRAYAEQNKLLAERNFEFTKSEVSLERQRLATRYTLAVAAIKTLPDLDRLEKKHSRVEKLFEQGLLSTSMFIEAHRQMQDFVQTRNEEEHEATDALWKIYALDGKIFEETLWTSIF